LDPRLKVRVKPRIEYRRLDGSVYMGNGQPVALIYIGIRLGWPQPMTATLVFGGSNDRDGIEVVRVARYSWQF